MLFLRIYEICRDILHIIIEDSLEITTILDNHRRADKADILNSMGIEHDIGVSHIHVKR